VDITPSTKHPRGTNKYACLSAKQSAQCIHSRRLLSYHTAQLLCVAETNVVNSRTNKTLTLHKQNIQTEEFRQTTVTSLASNSNVLSAISNYQRCCSHY